MDQIKLERWLCLLRKNGMYLQHISVDEITEEMCEEAVMNNGLALQYVPEKYKTYSICRKAVENDPMAVKYVGQYESLYHLAVQKNGMSLQHISEEKRTYDLCMEAMQSFQKTKQKIKGHTPLAYVPDRHKDEALLLCAFAGVKGSFNKRRVLRDIPTEYITPRFLQKAGIGRKDKLLYKFMDEPVFVINFSGLVAIFICVIALFICFLDNHADTKIFAIVSLGIVSLCIMLFGVFFFIVRILRMEYFLPTTRQQKQTAMKKFSCPICVQLFANEMCCSVRKARKTLEKAGLPYYDDENQENQDKEVLFSIEEFFVIISMFCLIALCITVLTLLIYFPSFIDLIYILSLVFDGLLMLLTWFYIKHIEENGFHAFYQCCWLVAMIMLGIFLLFGRVYNILWISLIAILLISIIASKISIKKYLSRKKNIAIPIRPYTAVMDIDIFGEENQAKIYIQKISEIAKKNISKRIAKAMENLLKDMPESEFIKDLIYTKLVYEIVLKYENLQKDTEQEDGAKVLEGIAELFELALLQKIDNENLDTVEDIKRDGKVFYDYATMNGLYKRN